MTQAATRPRPIAANRDSLLLPLANCPMPYPAMIHIGSKKLSASHGVLYGISVYAAKSPNAQNAVNMANRWRDLINATTAPTTDKINIGPSSFIPHLRYAQTPFCV